MTDSISSEVTMSLDEAVQELLLVLTGQTLVYDIAYDRFRAVTQLLNRALRGNALELEWSYYSELLNLGEVQGGEQTFTIDSDHRFRVINDDAVRLVTDAGIPVAWAYFLPRDALHKYTNRNGLWCSTTRNQLTFSRPLWTSEAGLHVELPVMREPTMFRLPTDPTVPVDPEILTQQVDFESPDLIIARAAWLYAQTDPIMQPRVQTLEDQYRNLMFQVIERDLAFTESPYMNEVLVPVTDSIYGESSHRPWPVANRRGPIMRAR